MALVSRLSYELRTNGSKDISPDYVLRMLNEVREDIASVDANFVDSDLAEVLAIIEAGKHEIQGKIQTIIDLSSAQSVVNAYRKKSEGGCQSCINLGIETIDAQDASSGWYCEDSDPDFNKAAGEKHGCKYSGFSQKVKAHYKNPCDSWLPKYSPPLAELIKGKK